MLPVRSKKDHRGHHSAVAARLPPACRLTMSQPEGGQEAPVTAFTRRHHTVESKRIINGCSTVTKGLAQPSEPLSRAYCY